MRCSATVSDKQTALVPAVASVFPHAKHGLCQVHYFKNAAEPVADADEALKKTLRQAVRLDLKAVLRPQSPENAGVLTVTGLLPSPIVALPANAASVAPVVPADPSLAATLATAERESIIQDVVQRVRYLLTLKGRPPFRLAGIETYERLEAVVQCLEQLIQHDPDPRLVKVYDGLSRALKVVQGDYVQLRQAADWLTQIAEILDPAGKPARSGAEVKAEWQTLLDQIKAEALATPLLRDFSEKIIKVSASYAPGLFYTYDVPREACHAPTMIAKASSAM